MKKTLLVLGAILFCPLAFLGLFEINLRFAFGMAPLYIGFPLLMALCFLLAGWRLKKLGMGRWPLWFLMNFIGYPLCWVGLTLRVPGLWFNLGILLLFLPVTAALAVTWGVVGLALLLVRLAKTPPARMKRKARSLGKGIVTAAKPLLLAAAVVGVLGAGYNYLTMRPAAAYTDQGVFTFVADNGYPTVEKTTRNGRTRERSVYQVVYKAQGSGYTYTEAAPGESLGRQYVREKRSLERRVLSITGENLYITVDGKYTLEGYVRTLRQRYLVVFGVSAGYLTAAAVWFIWKRRREEAPVESAADWKGGF